MPGSSASRTCSALPTPRLFRQAFRQSLHTVERHYAALFETAPQLSAGIGNLVFTGDVDDPDTLQTLAGLGFERPSDICRVIRGWHFGRYRATQSAEARERLTELTPALLKAFGETPPRRRGAAPLRCVPGRLAGRHPAVLAAAVQSVAAEAAGDDHGRGAAACRDDHHARPHVFDGLLDPALHVASCRTSAYLSGAPAILPRRRQRATRKSSTGCASSPPSRNS